MSTSDHSYTGRGDGARRTRRANATSTRAVLPTRRAVPPPPRDQMPEPIEIHPPDREAVRTDVPHESEERSAQARQQSAARPDGRPATHDPSSRERLRRALATPGAARRAILLSEVLDRPMSLRIDSDNYP